MWRPTSRATRDGCSRRRRRSSLAAALAPWWAWRRRRSSARLVLVLVSAVVLTIATYLAYTVFDDWWYIRFLLPALPVLLVLSVAVCARTRAPPSAPARRRRDRDRRRARRVAPARRAHAPRVRSPGAGVAIRDGRAATRRERLPANAVVSRCSRAAACATTAGGRRLRGTRSRPMRSIARSTALRPRRPSRRSSSSRTMRSRDSARGSPTQRLGGLGLAAARGGACAGARPCLRSGGARSVSRRRPVTTAHVR